MPRTVLFAIYPSFQLLDAAGPITAFEIATRFVPNAYVLRVAASTEGLVPSSSGVPMPAEKLRGINLARVDTLVVVGGMGVRGAVADKILVAALRRAPRRVRRIASVCSGSMLLATAGLLKDRRATTHWRVAGLLQRSFPSVHVEPDKIYTEDKGVWTSAGISAGIDLALALISDDLGPETASNVAREMVVYIQRPGGQTQHSALLDLDRRDGRFCALNAWMRTNLAEHLSVEQLARRAAMSPRNFARAYVAETGITPAKAVERLRLEAARTALQTGGAIQEIARRTGFGDTERMRCAFVRIYGASPDALRRTLRRAG